MTALPPELDPGDEIEITWHRDELSTKVTATLGEASVTVETTEDGSVVVPWLIGAMPNILDAAWAAIEADQEES